MTTISKKILTAIYVGCTLLVVVIFPLGTASAGMFDSLVGKSKLTITNIQDTHKALPVHAGDNLNSDVPCGGAYEAHENSRAVMLLGSDGFGAQIFNCAAKDPANQIRKYTIIAFSGVVGDTTISEIDKTTGTLANSPDELDKAIGNQSMENVRNDYQRLVYSGKFASTAFMFVGHNLGKSIVFEKLQFVSCDVPKAAQGYFAKLCAGPAAIKRAQDARAAELSQDRRRLLESICYDYDLCKHSHDRCGDMGVARDGDQTVTVAKKDLETVCKGCKSGIGGSIKCQPGYPKDLRSGRP